MFAGEAPARSDTIRRKRSKPDPEKGAPRSGTEPPGQPKPRGHDRDTRRDVRHVQTFGPEEWGRPMLARDAAELTQMMINIVEHGTARSRRSRRPPWQARRGRPSRTRNEPPHAWFVSLSPDDLPSRSSS
jgi:hypothetical protein